MVVEQVDLWDISVIEGQITDNGTSSGSVLYYFETIIDVISQGSTRRGRFSPYLPIDHPDEFFKNWYGPK